jgi:hypothetical protein
MMNERIRELAVSAGMTKMNQRSDGLYVVGEKAFELFATELILECANIVTIWSEEEPCSEGYDIMPVVKMKEYFGVEND